MQPLTIEGQIVEVVNKYSGRYLVRYLSIYIDCNLHFSENTDYIFKNL